MTNLPSGFDPEIWGEGWEKCKCLPDCTAISRTTAMGDIVRVEDFKEFPRYVVFSDYSRPKQCPTESEAAEFANHFADQRGGWMENND